jgi:hypothetical protein
MTANAKPHTPIDVVLYDRNRRQIPFETLAPYAGQWVAISGDGTRVIASGQSIEDLAAALKVAGIDGTAVGWERIPGLDEDTWL